MSHEKLAKAIIAQAAIDKVATRFPETMSRYIRQWNRFENGNGKLRIDDAWIEQRAQELDEFFENGGGELAQAVECEEYVRWAKSGTPNHEAAEKLTRHHKFSSNRGEE